MLVGTQTDISEERPETQEVFESSINYDIASQEEIAPKEEPPTMTRSQPEATQLKASHHEITEVIVATVNQATMTKAEEDTPLFPQRLQKVLAVKLIATATKKIKHLRPLVNFVKKRVWDAIKSAYGQYWFDRYPNTVASNNSEKPTLDTPRVGRQAGFMSKRSTHPLIKIQMAKNCKHCTEQGKNLKPVKGKNHLFQMSSVVEPNEEVQLDFAGPLPDELNKDAYILDAIGK